MLILDENFRRLLHLNSSYIYIYIYIYMHYIYKGFKCYQKTISCYDTIYINVIICCKAALKQHLL